MGGGDRDSDMGAEHQAQRHEGTRRILRTTSRVCPVGGAWRSETGERRKVVGCHLVDECLLGLCRFFSLLSLSKVVGF